MEEDLEQQVPELVGESPRALGVRVVDHLEDLVGLLQQVPRERGVGLPVRPGISVGRPQRLHHLHRSQQRAAARSGGLGIGWPVVLGGVLGG
ncbi:hypothetical protein [Brachybacterium sp. Z12]|uniref:hypothetical protein n=1 Tax=Brachybacterium sp. Z12 TaxID=2759167 RepID=UPI00223B29A6|nr:hypothetical protein [Brachybacterium sp. Z12]